MLDTFDRHSRDSTLFQFTTKRLRDFIDPNICLFRLMSALTSRSSLNPWKTVTAETTEDPPSIQRFSLERC